MSVSRLSTTTPGEKSSAVVSGSERTRTLHVLCGWRPPCAADCGGIPLRGSVDWIWRLGAGCQGSCDVPNPPAQTW